MDKPPLRAAIAIVGLVALARGLGVTHQAVRKWEIAGRLPRTEWTGETRYAETIERLTGGAVTKALLLMPWPVAEHVQAANLESMEARDAA